MKICVAQTKPIKGNIPKNIENHKNLLEIAIYNQADIIVFPELSLTGYEPELADELSISEIEDNRLNEFQVISNDNKIIIGVGMPTKNENGICISMIIFQPNKKRQIYSKHYLHPGEEKYFVSGQNTLPIELKNNKIAFAICYETSIFGHSETAHKNGADIYIASVLNSVNGVDNDIKRISEIAKRYSMISLMSNFTGKSGEYDCAGKTSIWNRQGVLVGQLNNKDEGIIIIDTENQEIFEKYV
jgi:predicted amidohydrolase